MSSYMTVCLIAFFVGVVVGLALESFARKQFLADEDDDESR